MKSSYTKKDQRSLTGGGPPPKDFSEAEGVLLNAAGDAINGIGGGIDNFCKLMHFSLYI